MRGNQLRRIVSKRLRTDYVKKGIGPEAYPHFIGAGEMISGIQQAILSH